MIVVMVLGWGAAKPAAPVADKLDAETFASLACLPADPGAIVAALLPCTLPKTIRRVVALGAV